MKKIFLPAAIVFSMMAFSVSAQTMTSANESVSTNVVFASNASSQPENPSVLEKIQRETEDILYITMSPVIDVAKFIDEKISTITDGKIFHSCNRHGKKSCGCMK